MSSFAGYCDWCDKPVMHKTFFGTLHVCLSDEEKAYILMQRQQALPSAEWSQLVANSRAKEPASRKLARGKGGQNG